MKGLTAEEITGIIGAVISGISALALAIIKALENYKKKKCEKECCKDDSTPVEKTQEVLKDV